MYRIVDPRTARPLCTVCTLDDAFTYARFWLNELEDSVQIQGPEGTFTVESDEDIDNLKDLI